jgi:hypothetical protein
MIRKSRARSIQSETIALWRGQVRSTRLSPAVVYGTGRGGNPRIEEIFNGTVERA